MKNEGKNGAVAGGLLTAHFRLLFYYKKSYRANPKITFQSGIPQCPKPVKIRRPFSQNMGTLCKAKIRFT